MNGGLLGALASDGKALSAGEIVHAAHESGTRDATARALERKYVESINPLVPPAPSAYRIRYGIFFAKGHHQ